MQTIINVAIVLTSLAGIVTSTALLWIKVIKPFVRFTRHMGEVVEVVQKLPDWCESVDECLAELKPNGGGSIKDKITNIQKTLDHHIEEHESYTPCEAFVPVRRND